MKLKKLSDYLDTRLGIYKIDDDSNNGLQVEASCEIRKIVFGVDASQELIDRAAETGADLIFVHHGLSWGTGFQRLIGLDAKRIGKLFQAGISLYAAHLPLDAHPELGHNACLAKIVGLTETDHYAEYHGTRIGVKGSLPAAMTAGQVARLIQTEIKGKEIIYGDPDCEIRRLGIISGGAGSDGILASAMEGLDAMITGEISHSSYHTVAESGITVIAAGHYASETPGIFAVMHEIGDKFGLETEFIDLPTGL